MILNRIVLRPSQHEIDAGVQMRFKFRTSIGTGEYFVHTNHDALDEKHRLLILKFPGTAGRAERSSLFPLSLMPGIQGTIATWNPPGYGGSEGKTTLKTIASTAFEFTQEAFARLGGAGQPVWLVGNSLGCCTAMHIASHPHFSRRIRGLVLRNPPPLADVVMHVAKQYPLGSLLEPVTRSLPPEMNARVTAKQILCPTLLLQSELDSLVPPDVQDQVFAAISAPKLKFVLPGVDHAGLVAPEDEAELSDRLMWLWSQQNAK